MAQGNIWGNAIGQGLGAIGGGLANYYGGLGQEKTGNIKPLQIMFS